MDNSTYYLVKRSNFYCEQVKDINDVKMSRNRDSIVIERTIEKGYNSNITYHYKLLNSLLQPIVFEVKGWKITGISSFHAWTPDGYIVKIQDPNNNYGEFTIHGIYASALSTMFTQLIEISKFTDLEHYNLFNENKRLEDKVRNLNESYERLLKENSILIEKIKSVKLILD